MKITEKAKEELKKALESFNKQEAGIHIFSTKGCCGPSIQMDIATQIANNETQISQDGIDFFVANDIISELENTTIEYNENGFRLIGLKKNSGCC